MNGKITYRQQYTRCGKQRCLKCKEGTGHGPYWYAYWSENGRTISKYIGIHPPAEVAEGKRSTFPVQKETATAVRDSGIPSPNIPSLSNSIHGTTERERRKSQAEAAPEAIASLPLLRVYLLGQFRVERKEEHEWQTVVNRTWQRRRARALLGCLLSQAGRRMGREQMMEALWPDLEIEVAANRLNGAVHELRQILEPGIERPAASKLLRLERDILTLADASHMWVDAEAFEALLNRANTTTDSTQVEQFLEKAWTLYEGDYLLEELYSEWATTRRESLRRGWMGLLLHLAELRAERGALTSAIEPLDRLLTADPTHETAVRRLMVLLTQLDRRGEAIRAYQQLTAILKRDYESEPLPETIELYKALRQGQIQASRSLSDPLPARNALHTRDAEYPSEAASDQDKTMSPIPWQLLPRPALPPGRQNQSPLVGREHELESIRQILLAINAIAPHEGPGVNKKTGTPEPRPRLAHFVMIMGETGIGKTRLAEELSQEAYLIGWRVAWTRTYEQEGTIPYRPWTDILRTLLQDIPLDYLINIVEGKTGQIIGDISKALNPAATAQAKLTRLSSLLPELATSQALHLQQNRSQPLPAPEQERFHLWEAMLSLLNALSHPTPLLLILDDLHWADDSSLELLAYLARHQQNERILLVGTCRDIELAQSGNLRALLNDLRREQVLVTFPLQSLTRTQIGRLIAHLPHEQVQSIQGQAGGNPLFAEELARFSEAMPGTGSKKETKNGGNSHYSGRDDERTPGINGANRPTSMPETIAAVLERRLNKLSGECQALLSRATVLGGSFEFGLLVRMTGEAGTNEDATLDLLEEALRSGLLTEEVNGARIVYHFWHPLIVNHLYENLSAARRAQLHRRAAQALIELQSGNAAKGAAAIAYHLGKYGQEKHKLAYYAEIAGNQALALSAYPEALHHYRQALESLQTVNAATPDAEQDPMHLASLLECVAECNVMQGNAQEARDQYIQVLELHQTLRKDASMFASPEEFLAWQQEEAQIQGMIWRAIGRAWQSTSEFDQAHECAERGKQVLRAAGITTGAAWACLQHLDGGIYWAEGKFTEARRYMEDALEIHKEVRRAIRENANAGQVCRDDALAPLMTHSRRALLGDPLELGRAHESLGVVAASMGQYTEALQHLHTALAILEEHDLVGMLSQVCGNIGAVYAMRAEYTIASTYFKRALELCERTGDIPSRVLVTGNLGDAAARNGDLPEAAIWLTDSLALAEQISDREYTSWGLVALATVQQDLGNLRESLESIRHALAIGRHMKSTVRVGFALVALADWRVTCAMIPSNRDTPFLASKGHEYRKIASREGLRLLRAAKAAVERALALEDIEAEAQSIGQVVLGTIYYQLGNLESALLHTMKALEATRQSQMMQMVGRSQRLLGEIQAASSLELEANASFEQALQIFKQHGLRLDYARTLYTYGISLLKRSLQRQTGDDASTDLFSAGLGNLREARGIFDTCKASIDLQRVERVLAEIAHKQKAPL